MVRLVQAETEARGDKPYNNPYGSGALEEGLYVTFQDLTSSTYTTVAKILSSLAPFADTAMWMDLVQLDGEPKLWGRFDPWMDLAYRDCCKSTDILVLQGSSFTSGRSFSAKTYDEINTALCYRIGTKGKVTISIDRYIDTLPVIEQAKALQELRGGISER
jgi:hypothetical protein